MGWGITGVGGGDNGWGDGLGERHSADTDTLRPISELDDVDAGNYTRSTYKWIMKRERKREKGVGGARAVRGGKNIDDRYHIN